MQETYWDAIIQHKGCTVQHGRHNNRVYLMAVSEPVPLSLELDLVELARIHGYTKVFVCVPAASAQPFEWEGYRVEAEVPDYYQNGDSALFMARYLHAERSIEKEEERMQTILGQALQVQKQSGTSSRAKSAVPLVRRCTAADVAAMTCLYADVFQSYPFPIFTPAYVLDGMQKAEQAAGQRVRYYGIETQGSLVALASADYNSQQGHVEMTDFATLPAWRGKGFARHLLAHMEEDMRSLHLRTAYTIARALSPGMNAAFAAQGYAFGGRIANNTQISGTIESMNVWYKKL